MCIQCTTDPDNSDISAYSVILIRFQCHNINPITGQNTSIELRTILNKTYVLSTLII